nr:NADH dehydrogenase subunit 4 [Sinelater perroti]
MMSFIFFLIFMIPLSFNGYWMYQLSTFFFMFLFIISFSMSIDFSLLSYGFGSDWLSYLMILLSIWVCSLMILASVKIYSGNFYYFYFLVVMTFMLMSLFFTFSSVNMFIFYIFFEVSLLPTLMLILGWGYQPERLQAGIYMFFYTLFGSLPMMISIFHFYFYFSTLDFFFLRESVNSILLYVCTIAVFLVKIPMFFVHLWLPKAHVEAPVSGSMILAGVMLKLGGYGFLRVMPLFLKIGYSWNLTFIVISLFGGMVISLVCLRQSDIKSLVAYSSVSHMGLALSGIMTLNIWGYYGSVMMMVAHGLCSSGLFCLANISYERFSSRSLFLNKGMINLMPSMSLWWFLLCSSNMAAPPSLNLMGEIMLINSVVSWSLLGIGFLMLMSFFSAAYSLYLYSYSQHGMTYEGVYSFNLGVVREYLLMFLHWVPLNLMFLLVDLLI